MVTFDLYLNILALISVNLVSFLSTDTDVLSSSTVNSKCDHTFKVTLAYIAGEIGLLHSHFVLFAIPVREAFALFVKEIDGNRKKICS